MKKIVKGEYGYLKAQKNMECLKTIVFFGAALGVLGLGIYISGTKNNLLTIIAVLGLLPASKELISLIMFLKAQKYACSGEIYQNIENKQPDESNLPVIYDVYMTSQEKNFPMQSMSCRNKTLIGLTNFKNFDEKKAMEHISSLLKQNGYKGVSIKIFTEEGKYLQRIEDLKELPVEDINTDQGILRLMLNISL